MNLINLVSTLEFFENECPMITNLSLILSLRAVYKHSREREREGGRQSVFPPDFAAPQPFRSFTRELKR